MSAKPQPNAPATTIETVNGFQLTTFVYWYGVTEIFVRQYDGGEPLVQISHTKSEPWFVYRWRASAARGQKCGSRAKALTAAIMTAANIRDGI